MVEFCHHTVVLDGPHSSKNQKLLAAGQKNVVSCGMYHWEYQDRSTVIIGAQDSLDLSL